MNERPPEESERRAERMNDTRASDDETRAVDPMLEARRRSHSRNVLEVDARSLIIIQSDFHCVFCERNVQLFCFTNCVRVSEV